MNLFKRGNVWWVKYVRHGVEHRKSAGTRSKTQAQSFLNTMRMAVEKPTFEAAVEFLRDWFGDAKAEAGIELGSSWEKYAELAKATGKDALSSETWRKRRQKVNALVDWLKDNTDARYVEDVDGIIAAKYAASLAKEGRKSKTRRNILGELSIVWKLLEKASSRVRNPWSGLSPRDTDGVRLLAFTDDEAKKVMAAAEKIGKGWPLACLISLRTGLRYGDIANMKWCAVDFKKGVIRVTPNKTAAHGITVVVPIMPALLKALKEAYKERDKGSDFVLPMHGLLYGKHTRHAQNALNFREVLNAAGIKDKLHTFHSWRHTFRTKLAAAGVSTETAMRLCGHTDEQTSARYDHDEHLDELRAAVDAASRK